MTKRGGTIEDDTPLVPAIVADCVVDEVAVALDCAGTEPAREALGKISDPKTRRVFAEHLSEVAETRYVRDAAFRDALAGDECREELYSAMRVAAATYLVANMGRAAANALPDGFDRGEAPPPPSPPGMKFG